MEYIKLEIKDNIGLVTLNNPKKANSLNVKMWGEIKDVFKEMDQNDDVRVCIIKANGKNFSSGIDINYLIDIIENKNKIEVNLQTDHMRTAILEMQESFNAIEDCKKPVIAAIHGICIGAGVDLIAACDIRYSLYQAFFSIKETELGIVADMGTIQRLPYIIGDGDLKELALTSKNFSGLKAKKVGLINKCFLSKQGLHKYSFKIAKLIAKHPVDAVQGTKTTINFNRSDNVRRGLVNVAELNSNLLNSPQVDASLKNIQEKLKRS